MDEALKREKNQRCKTGDLHQAKMHFLTPTRGDAGFPSWLTTTQNYRGHNIWHKIHESKGNIWADITFYT